MKQLLFLLCLVLTAGAQPFYVAPNGSDSNPGTQAKPFQSFEASRTALETAGYGGTAYIGGGNYYRTNTFTLTTADSGQLWTNVPGQVPVIIGGVLVNQWSTYLTNIMVANVSNILGNVGQLFFNNQRMWMARYPKYVSTNPVYGGYLYVAGTPTNQYAAYPGESFTNFSFNPGDIPNWTNPAYAQLVIFPRHNWWNDVEPIASINTNTYVVYLNSPTEYTMRPADRYYIQNVFQALSAPGEWYYDSPSGNLYFYPPSTITESTPVIVPTVGNLVSISSGASNITWMGMTMRYCTNSAVTMTGTTNCLFARNTIQNCGDFYTIAAVSVNGGFTNGVQGNNIFYCANTAIYLTGGTTTNLSPANNYADNNYIHDFGILDKGWDGGNGVGIYVLGVGNRVSQNYMANGPRDGILFAGQNLLIQSNEVNNVMLETDDAGPIYTYGENWLYDRGTTIAGNYVHDSPSFGYAPQYGTGPSQITAPCQSEGIYLDGLACGVNILGNIIARTTGSGIFYNGGSDNIVSNNIIVNCLHTSTPLGGNNQFLLQGFPSNNASWYNSTNTFEAQYDTVKGLPQWSGMRGMTVPPVLHFEGVNGYTAWSNYFVCNIIMWTNQLFGTNIAVGYAINYPEMEPIWNPCNSNLFYNVGTSPTFETNSTPLTFAQWQSIPMDAAGISANPAFNVGNSNQFTLSASSPAVTTLGFVPIQMANIGPYQSAQRATWPITPVQNVGIVITNSGKVNLLLY